MRSRRESLRFGWLITLLAVQLATAATEHAIAYRDRMNRFELTVPAGWKVRSLGDGVQVVRGDAYASVMIFEHASDAASLIEDLQSQVGKKWRRFEIVKRAESTLSGQKATALWAAGVNSEGQEASLKLTGVIFGDVGYALLIGLSNAEGKMADTLAEIERSFQVLPAGNASATPTIQTPTAGLEVTELSADDAETYKLHEAKGVLVLRVSPDGPAQKAGLKFYDVVLEIDGQSVDSGASLQQIVQSHKIGDSIQLQILRLTQDKKAETVSATITLEPAHQ